MPRKRTPEQIAAWKKKMDEARARKAAQGAVAVMERPAKAPDEVEGIPAEALASLRKNYTTKEGVGVAFGMALELYERRAVQIWPEFHTVLVSNGEINGNTQVNEYEGYGYWVVEDGKKSQFTVPNRDMTRMACLLVDWERQEHERVMEQNSRHDLARIGLPKDLVKGKPVNEVEQTPKRMSEILAQADVNAARVAQPEVLDEATQAEYDKLVAQGHVPAN